MRQLSMAYMDANIDLDPQSTAYSLLNDAVNIIYNAIGHLYHQMDRLVPGRHFIPIFENHALQSLTE